MNSGMIDYSDFASKTDKEAKALVDKMTEEEMRSYILRTNKLLKKERAEAKKYDDTIRPLKKKVSELKTKLEISKNKFKYQGVRPTTIKATYCTRECSRCSHYNWWYEGELHCGADEDYRCVFSEEVEDVIVALCWTKDEDDRYTYVDDEFRTHEVFAEKWEVLNRKGR